MIQGREAGGPKLSKEKFVPSKGASMPTSSIVEVSPGLSLKLKPVMQEHYNSLFKWGFDSDYLKRLQDLGKRELATGAGMRILLLS
jgi:hypothetical protein